MEKKLKIALELDDFSPRNSHLSLLETLREHYPSFKVTMFTVPWEIRWGQPTPITQDEYSPWVRAVKNADWIEIASHGLTHLPEEFGEISYEGAKKRLLTAEKMYENRGINLVKIFKAPHWCLSEEGKKAAEDLGYTVVEDHYYQWNIKDEFPEALKDYDGIIIAHGHVQDTMGNGLEESLPRLMKLPPGTEFYKLSDVLWKQ